MKSIASVSRKPKRFLAENESLQGTLEGIHVMFPLHILHFLLGNENNYIDSEQFSTSLSISEVKDLELRCYLELIFIQPTF